MGVGQALFPKRAFRPVARGEGDVIAQWQQLVLDRVDQVCMVAPGKSVRPMLPANSTSPT